MAKPGRVDRQPMRVLVAGHNLLFARGIIQFCGAHPDVEVEVDEWQSHRAHDRRASLKLLARADVVWAEWCLGNAVWYSQHLLPHQKLLIRFHRQELETGFPGDLYLPRVRRIVFISPYVMERARERFGWPADLLTVICNAVDVPRFDRPKLPGAEFRLGLLGMCPWLKRPDRALEILEDLRDLDERYTLSIKGKLPHEYKWLLKRKHEQLAYGWFYDRLRTSLHGEAVTFEPWGEDVVDWFRNVGIILSTSDMESCHLGVLEGMASGANAVVWDWPGARDQYPPEIIVGSVREAAQRILELRLPGRAEALVGDGRSFARNRNDLRLIGAMWLDLLRRAGAEAAGAGEA